MILLETLGIPGAFLIGTIGMLCLAIALIVFIIFHQRNVIRYQLKMQQMDAEQQKVLLQASIKFQEEERQKIAADLHDDAGPLLATARLYLTENLVNQNKETQLHSIITAKQIIDEAIQLIRNISHSLLPPTLKNFGLESAVNDFFNKIGGAGTLDVYSRFYDYTARLKPEKELVAFRVIQELTNNILKHSNPTFIHLNQQTTEHFVQIGIEHDGKGLTQPEYLEMSKGPQGLGLKNIQSRLKLAQGNIFFELNPATSHYKITIDLPKDQEEEWGF